MNEDQKILEFCIQFSKLTLHENFKLNDGHYSSDCGKHHIKFLRNNDTIAKVGHSTKVVQINSEICDLSFTTRLFFCLWSFMILKCGKSEERADLVTITLMQSVWKSQNLSDRDLSIDIINFMRKHESYLNRKRIKNIMSFLVVKNELIT